MCLRWLVKNFRGEGRTGWSKRFSESKGPPIAGLLPPVISFLGLPNEIPQTVAQYNKVTVSWSWRPEVQNKVPTGPCTFTLPDFSWFVGNFQHSLVCRYTTPIFAFIIVTFSLCVCLHIAFIF